MKPLYRLPITGDFISLGEVTDIRVINLCFYGMNKPEWSVRIELGEYGPSIINCKSARHAASVRTQIFSAREKERVEKERAEIEAQQRWTPNASKCSRDEFRNILCRLNGLDWDELKAKGVSDQGLQRFTNWFPAKAYIHSDTETIDIIWPMISGEATLPENKEQS